MNIKQFLAVVAVAGLVGSNVWAAGAPVKAADGVLVGPNDMTLYTFDKDAAGSGKSVCNGPCVANWPPLAAAAADSAGGDYSIVTRRITIRSGEESVFCSTALLRRGFISADIQEPTRFPRRRCAVPAPRAYLIA